MLRGDLLGAPEVDDFDMMIGVEQNVLRLDVPVDDALGVHLNVGLDQLLEDR